MTIPNFITVARVLIVPFVVFTMMNSDWKTATALFVLAGVSDGIDGFIARRFDQQSEFGAWLDPIADKLLLVSVFVMLAVKSELPAWLVVLVVSRDLMIITAVMLSSLMAHPVEMRPIFVSKLNTAMQIVLVTLVLVDLAFSIGLPVLRSLAVLSVAVLTAVSAAAYLVTWLRHMAGYSK